MIHPAMELRFINELIGSGLIAAEPVPIGTIVFFQDPLDQVFTPQQVAGMPAVFQELVDKYGYQDRRGDWIFGWDRSIYTNHSCEPNALDTALGFEIAIRDIQPGEELTIDYGLLNLTEDMPVSCGCTNCRKVLQPSDFERFAALWDSQIQTALKAVRSVPQPLWTYMDAALIDRLTAVMDGTLPYPSVLEMKYFPNEAH